MNITISKLAYYPQPQRAVITDFINEHKKYDVTQLMLNAVVDLIGWCIENDAKVCVVVKDNQKYNIASYKIAENVNSIHHISEAKLDFMVDSCVLQGKFDETAGLMTYSWSDLFLQEVEIS